MSAPEKEGVNVGARSCVWISPIHWSTIRPRCYCCSGCHQHFKAADLVASRARARAGFSLTMLTLWILSGAKISLNNTLVSPSVQRSGSSVHS